MKVEFKNVTIQFDSTKNKLQIEPGTAVFSGRVIRATAMLNGYNIRFNNGNHSILEQQIDLDVTGISGNTVRVRGEFGIRDNGGYDDPYSGWITCVVLAQVA